MEGFMEVELMVTKRDDNRRPTDRGNIEQSALEDGMAEFCNRRVIKTLNRGQLLVEDYQYQSTKIKLCLFYIGADLLICILS